MKKSVVAQIEAFVEKVTKDAAQMVDIDRRLDALKILQPFYTVMKKTQGKIIIDDENEPTMDELQQRLLEVDHRHDQ